MVELSKQSPINKAAACPRSGHYLPSETAQTPEVKGAVKVEKWKKLLISAFP